VWYCNRCKEHVRAWKQYHLYRSPPILIVHLKRFKYSASTHRRDKINTFIDFPLEGLDLTTQVMHWTEGEKPIYDCYAVSNRKYHEEQRRSEHLPPARPHTHEAFSNLPTLCLYFPGRKDYGGLGGGHYTAYALNDDGLWCYYDDSRVTTNVDPKEVISDSAYCLYYRRRDVPVGEEFVVNMQTAPCVQIQPAIIRDPVEKGESSDGSNSNAAIVDEEERMDVDDLASRSTSPASAMESLEGNNFDDMDGGNNLHDDTLPLQ